MSDIATRLQIGYTDAADGSSSSRSWNNINPEAGDAALVNMAKQMNSLQDSTVKTMTSVKRVDTRTLDMNAEA